jgi:hypothetical protein
MEKVTRPSWNDYFKPGIALQNPWFIYYNSNSSTNFLWDDTCFSKHISSKLV